MKVVILAGGKGTRLGSVTKTIPKPMVCVGRKPLLWHVMSIYAAQGFDEFLICGGYKIEVIGQWLERSSLPWNIRLIDTGQEATTGSRVKQLERYLSSAFHLSYGDGVGNINISELVKFHGAHQSFCTVSAVHPPPRFGELNLEGDYVTKWSEKQPGPGWINGGFYVVEPEALDFIDPSLAWEYGACCEMAQRGLMTAYHHTGFWMCADYKEDIAMLQKKWKEGAWSGLESAS